MDPVSTFQIPVLPALSLNWRYQGKKFGSDEPSEASETTSYSSTTSDCNTRVKYTIASTGTLDMWVRCVCRYVRRNNGEVQFGTGCSAKNSVQKVFTSLKAFP